MMPTGPVRQVPPDFFSMDGETLLPGLTIGKYSALNLDVRFTGEIAGVEITDRLADALRRVHASAVVWAWESVAGRVEQMQETLGRMWADHPEADAHLVCIEMSDGPRSFDSWEEFKSWLEEAS